MRIRTPEDLYLAMLRETHDAEMQLTRALPRMARAADSPELEKAFWDHHAQTEDQIVRLEEILDDLGEGVGTMRCVGMEGIVAEGEDLMHDDAEPELLDAALIVAAQKVEHYEIAAYGALRSFAQMLGRRQDVRLLDETLEEESDTDELLTQLAMRAINPAALGV